MWIGRLHYILDKKYKKFTFFINFNKDTHIDQNCNSSRSLMQRAYLNTYYTYTYNNFHT